MICPESRDRLRQSYDPVSLHAPPAARAHAAIRFSIAQRLRSSRQKHRSLTVVINTTQRVLPEFTHQNVRLGSSVTPFLTQRQDVAGDLAGCDLSPFDIETSTITKERSPDSVVHGHLDLESLGRIVEPFPHVGCPAE